MTFFFAEGAYAGQRLPQNKQALWGHLAAFYTIQVQGGVVAVAQCTTQTVAGVIPIHQKNVQSS
jgi:hypothetical protein